MYFAVIRLNRLAVGAGLLLLLIGFGLGVYQHYQSLRQTPTLQVRQESTLQMQTTPILPSQNESTEKPSAPTDLVADCITALGPLLEVRAHAIQTGDVDSLRTLYDTSFKTGLWALEHQQRRVQYLKAWAAKRGIHFSDSSVSYRVVRSKKKSNSVWLYVIQSSSFGYTYKDDTVNLPNQFGIGTRHVMELVWRGKWQFKSDWFTDPLDEDTLIPDVVPALASDDPDWAQPQEVMRWVVPAEAIPILTESDDSQAALPVARPSRRYARDAAVAYADRYCGAAVGCGNNGRYNQNYRDYTGLGGDCTNFVSQVLGDQEGGALRKTSTWRYDGKGSNRAGSTAWVQTDSFGHYLSYSGIATRIARATYTKVANPTTEQPLGLVGTLQPGDVIGYQEKGDLVHFAVITAKDSRGVPLVNSHTADRYHVPWDLGWDRNTVYWLYRLRD